MKKISTLAAFAVQSVFTVNRGKQPFASFLFLFFLCFINAQAQHLVAPVQETYSRVKVKTNPRQFPLLNDAIGFDHVKLESDWSFIGEFSQSEIAKMTSLGATVKVLIPDMVKYTAQKNSSSRLAFSSHADALLPNGFTYGSMGGYYTFAEIVAKLDSLRSMYPNLISVKQSIGKSTENRDLWVVKISDNPDNDEDEPKVFYNALTHAREPAGMMQMFYYMCYILQNYNSNPEIKHLVDNRELYFEPCVNPDGYEYNRSLSATGGGMWRKNRSKVTTTTTTVKNCHNVTIKQCDTTWKTTKTYTLANCISTTVKLCDTTWKTPTSYTVKNCHNVTTKTCDTIWKITTTYTVNCRNLTIVVCDTTRTNNTTVYGVDLNRNYGYKWGFDNTGSSTTQTSDTYRGPYAFSEPEITAIRDFSILKQFKDVSNQHTYANAATYAYSYKDGIVIPDQALYSLKNNLITEDNHFTIGHMLQTCGYLANGESSDWQYGEQTTKPKAYSWSPELGGSTDGFWPPQSRIEPLCLTMIRMNTNIAWIAGEYFRCAAPANLTATTSIYNLPVTITNYGDKTGSVEKITFVSNDAIGTGTDSIALTDIVPGAIPTKNLSLDLSGYSGTGTINGFLRITYPDGYTQDIPYNLNYAFPSNARKAFTTQENDKAKTSNIYSFYPNPVNDMLYINSTENITPVSISIYDLKGTLITRVDHQNQVSLSGIPAGMYEIKIETGNEIISDKILKQ